jgi:hypothetical protein
MTKGEEPILFPTGITHSDMASYIGCEIISAGFVAFKTNKTGDVEAEAFGHSMTLNLESRKEDSEIITQNILI